MSDRPPVLPCRTVNGQARMSVQADRLKLDSLTSFKRLPEFAEYAGSMAYCAGFPWWMAWAWAGTMAGLTDYSELHRLALHFLVGWECERFHAEGGRALPPVIQLHRQGSKDGLGDFPSHQPIDS